MRHVAFTVLFLYSLTVIKHAIPFVDFLINKEEIQTELCVNKDKPITVCGGSCYLEQRLIQTSDDSTEAKGTTSERTITHIFDFLFAQPLKSVSLYGSTQHTTIKVITNALLPNSPTLEMTTPPPRGWMKACYPQILIWWYDLHFNRRTHTLLIWILSRGISIFIQ